MNENRENRTPSMEEAFSEPTAEKRIYTVADGIFALLFLVFGYLAARWVLCVPESQGLGTFVLTAGITGMSFVYLRQKKMPVGVKGSLPFLLILLYSSVLVLSDNGFIKFLAAAFAVIVFLYAVLSVTGNRAEEKLGEFLLFDLLKSVLVMPLARLGALFQAPAGAAKNTAFGKKLLLILGGVLAAILPTAVIFTQLLQADGAFANLSDRLFSGIFENLPRELLYFCLGIPAAMLCFSALYANTDRAAKDFLTKSQCESTRDLLRFVPVLFTAAAVTPILLVYVLFFFSQTSYFLSAFEGIRPQGLTYAAYARNGFFELCRVSVINLLVILCAETFTKRKEGRKSPVIKGAVITLCLFTLSLIAIALSKMILYIDAYGLSLKRLYPTWFMTVLTVLFLLILLSQFVKKLPVLRTFAITFTVLFGVLLFSDADALVARYNVNAYKTGKLDTVDVTMMYDLSSSAVPYVLPLTEDENEAVAEKAKEYVEWKKQELAARKDTFANFNLAVHRAKKLLDE